MSQRHRTAEVLVPIKQEVRAHAHSERHRVHVELRSVAQDVSAGVDPRDVHEPGEEWRPLHHHDAEIAKTKLAKRNRTKRHWKTKMWKRRTQMRRDRAAALQAARANAGLSIQ
ncbi:MAG: hypothetical protein KUG57_09475 [Ilumatobacteraceae bacterium]|nr:hypothetical protein [Ilumatobacteraceae bacterium]